MQDADKNHELVSALVDGQLRGAEFARTVDWLNQDEEARMTWRTYHVVGAVLRTGNADVSQRDAAFMQRLKLSLQQEQAVKPLSSATELIAAHALSTGAGGLKGL